MEMVKKFSGTRKLKLVETGRKKFYKDCKSSNGSDSDCEPPGRKAKEGRKESKSSGVKSKNIKKRCKKRSKRTNRKQPSIEPATEEKNDKTRNTKVIKPSRVSPSGCHSRASHTCHASNQRPSLEKNPLSAINMAINAMSTLKRYYEAYPNAKLVKAFTKIENDLEQTYKYEFGKAISQ